MYPTNQEQEIAFTIINKYFLLGFNKVFTREINIYDWMEEHKNLLEETIDFGASKMVIISNQLNNWVIKIGFGNDSSQDYAAREARNYTKAIRSGIANFFAETYNIGELNGISIILQEKLLIDEYMIDSIIGDEVGRRAEKVYKEEVLVDSDIDKDDIFDNIYDDLEDYDRIEILLTNPSYQLLNFIDDNYINDLHTGNFGFIYENNSINKKRKVKIIDFSGYELEVDEFKV